MAKKDPKVDDYLSRRKNWKKEESKLRQITLDCGLEEGFKWKHPCYTYNGNNVVLIHGFKEYCAVLFFKGVLLKDQNDILIQQTENVQAARQMRFASLGEILQMERALKDYIYEAVEIEKSGKKVALKKTEDFKMPVEFENRLHDLPDLKKAFYALTPGRQRGYLLYFSSAKQSKTREARIEKYLKNILSGKGLND